MLATLRSVAAAIAEAIARGLRVEWILVLDAADQSTKDFLTQNLPGGARTINVEVRDLGAARNAGIAVACGEYAAIADADDLWSANWLSDAHSFVEKLGKPVVAHPKVVLTFEKSESITISIDSDADDFNPATLLKTNCWSAHSFGRRQIYLDIPFNTGLDVRNGFAFE